MQVKNGFLFVCGGFLAVVAVLAIVGSSSAAGGTTAGINLSEYQGTISVTGSGTVYTVPDLAQVTVGVVTESPTSTKAMADNANQMDAVVRAVKALGIAEKDIRTSTVSLQPKYSYDYPTTSSSYYVPALRQNITGYTATNTVTVTVRDMSRIGAVIDAAYGSGSNEINGVSFLLSDELQSKVYNEALTAAVKEGSNKADTIADAAGVSNIKLKTISESSSYYPVYYESFTKSDVSGAAAPTVVSPGQQKVTATVSMTYVYLPQ